MRQSKWIVVSFLEVDVLWISNSGKVGSLLKFGGENGQFKKTQFLV